MPIQFAPTDGRALVGCAIGAPARRGDGTSSDDPPPDEGGAMSFRIPPGLGRGCRGMLSRQVPGSSQGEGPIRAERSVFPQVQDRRSSEAQPQEPSQPKQSSGRGRDSIVLVKLPETVHVFRREWFHVQASWPHSGAAVLGDSGSPGSFPRAGRDLDDAARRRSHGPSRPDADRFRRCHRQHGSDPEPGAIRYPGRDPDP